jgi:dTDP-4-dehydrorhamnose 3,5-epimerase
MTEINESALIPGVKHVHFRVFADERGQFMETFRTAWFPDRAWHAVQSNRSESKAGVLRGLHFHHRQVDFWQVLNGEIVVALADVRHGSPAFGAVETVCLDATAARGLFIPTGVAHGFLARTATTLLYIVDQYYDGSDELGVAWNDPELDIDWGHENPIVSSRDRNNPLLREIPRDRLPDWRG